MRWETLFADLESQLEARAAGDLREEIAESTRVEKARQSFNDRLLGYTGMPVTLRLAGEQEVTGRLGPVGGDYLCLESAERQWLIRRAALQAIAVPVESTGRTGTVTRSRWGAVVRALLRDRLPVAVYALDGATLGEGTVHQAAEDFLLLATHPRDEYARPRSVQEHLLIPYESIGWIESGAPG